jgi:hypothetical protein
MHSEVVRQSDSTTCKFCHNTFADSAVYVAHVNAMHKDKVRRWIFLCGPPEVLGCRRSYRMVRP